MPSIPSNKFQKRIGDLRNEALSPGTGTTHTAMGVLVEVYDQERLELIKPDALLSRKLISSPGLLFAKVRLVNGNEYILPFKDPEDYVYLTYGNGFHLEGRTVKISWTGMSLESATIELSRSWAEQHVSIPRASATFDIGALF
jgi:hypothetical protein